jgi:tetratricopeptide (TPR) repeat protein
MSTRAAPLAALAGLVCLTLAAAGQAGPAVPGSRPGDPDHVVLNLGDRALADRLVALRAAHARSPGDTQLAVRYATALVGEGRRSGIERYFGWAEAVLARLAPKSKDVALLSLYADTLQFRHEFAAAEQVLDKVLRLDAHRASAYLARGQVRIAQGKGRAAIGDCLSAAHGAEPLAAAACLALARSTLGEVPAALDLVLASLAGSTSGGAVRSYASGVAAELAAHLGRRDVAEHWHREAVAHADNHFPVLAYADFLLNQHRAADAIRLLAGQPDSQAVEERRERARSQLRQRGASRKVRA